MEEEFSEKKEDKIEPERKERLDFVEGWEKEVELSEKRALSEEEKGLREELEQEVMKVKLSTQAQVQAQVQAEEIKKQAVEGQIRHLLDLAQAQGLAFSVEVARRTNNHYLIDKFHDTLTQGGLFKKFLRKRSS